MLLEYHKVLIRLHLLDDTVHFRNILVDLPVYQSQEQRLAHFFYTIYHLVIVIYIDKPRDQPLFFIRLDVLVKLRHILQVYRDKVLLLRRHLKQQPRIVKALHRDPA